VQRPATSCRVHDSCKSSLKSCIINEKSQVRCGPDGCPSDGQDHACQGSAAYFSLDDPDERLRLSSDAVRRLDHGTRPVILDEVQKQPALLDAVKLLADRQQGHRFLLLGSSQILLLRQVRETLAGRATLLELWPLALAEKVEGNTVPPSGFGLIWDRGIEGIRQVADHAPSAEAGRTWREKAEDHLRWGGYPALEPLPEQERATWLRDFRRTCLERDLADLGRVADLDQLALAQNLLAARTARLLSYSEVSRELGVAVNTVKRYIRLLELSYQVYLLRPLLPTVSARLVKSPKLYWTDPGLARVLSDRIGAVDGELFETAVLCELLRWMSWQPDRSDARPLAEFLDTARIPGVRSDAWRVGMVVTRGREVQHLAPHVWAIPDWRLFGPASMEGSP